MFTLLYLFLCTSLELCTTMPKEKSKLEYRLTMHPQLYLSTITQCLCMLYSWPCNQMWPALSSSNWSKQCRHLMHMTGQILCWYCCLCMVLWRHWLHWWSTALKSLCKAFSMDQWCMCYTQPNLLCTICEHQARWIGIQTQSSVMLQQCVFDCFSTHVALSFQ